MHLYKDIILFKLSLSSMHIIWFIKWLLINNVYSILSLIINDFKLIYFKFELPANIYAILDTLEKLKFDKSKDFKFLLSRNIALIFSIDEVLNLDKFKEVINEQSSNIWKKLVTCEVSNSDISNDVREIHLTNIAAIDWTFGVLKLEIFSDSNS